MKRGFSDKMSLSGTAFSSDGVEVMTRQVQATSSSYRKERSEEDIRSYYDIDRCAMFVTEGDYHRVALQFPDWLLCDAAQVAAILMEETAQTVFILADTSYGSCCVDEIAAEHNGADCIIHFGASCLTRTRRLPVLFVFGKEMVDVRDCERAFIETFAARDEHILVLYDTLYSHCISEFAQNITSDYESCVVSELSVPSVNPRERSAILGSQNHTQPSCEACMACQNDRHSRCEKPDVEASPPEDTTLGPATVSSAVEECKTGEESVEKASVSDALKPHSYDRFGRRFQLSCELEHYRVFYIGTEGPTLTNLIVNYSKCQFFSYDPVTNISRQETLNVNKALGRRYFLVQKAKEAKTVGILVGTLGAASYLEIIERLKLVLKQAGKKYYTVAVGKLNVPKMANFLEIDLFVLVACPENSLIDSQEFFKPVVTPYEMEIACIRSKEWTGEYSTDYQELLPGAVFHTSLDENAGEVEPEFSLITGAFVPTKESNQFEGDQSLSVVPRSKMEVSLPNSAASYLQQRSWQGLERKLGESEVSEAVVGRTGIATAYAHEPTT